MCTSPSLAINLGVNPDTGKQVIKFKRPRIGFSLQDYYDQYGKERVMLMPCGSCLECRLKYRKEWALRCTAEALSYGENNLFLTLTYDDEHCPLKLNKSHLQAFWKRLRAYGNVRYFACGEYGEKTQRPHYHAIVFGFRPSDLHFEFKNVQGFSVFSSEIISNCWKRGHVEINNFSPETAAYVAGYVNKKVGDDKGFIIMSRRPGIGFFWFVDNKLDIYKYDNIILNGVHSTPRFFIKLLEKEGFDLARLKLDRKQKAIDSFNWDLQHHSFNYLEDVLRSRRIVVEKRLVNSNRRSLC